MTDLPAARAPIKIDASRKDLALHVAWPDGVRSLPYRRLRGECGCAQCVNEWTGERMLDVSQIPEDIFIERMELVGSYALRVYWSDGHHSGLFTWERLREIAA